MAFFPNVFGLQSKYNDKYLRYVIGGNEHGFLRFSGEEVVSPFTKYEVEPAKSIGAGEGRLVHIRSCYNNKYWRAKSDYENWILADADEPEEDRTKWSCTMFELEQVPVESGDARTILSRIRHVRLGYYVKLWVAEAPYGECLFAGRPQPGDQTRNLFEVIDLESMFVLPRHVTFIGDNDLYLSARMFRGRQQLQFLSTQVGDATAAHHVLINSDGSVCIKSEHFNQYWKRTSSVPNWILADADESSDNTVDYDMHFFPFKVPFDSVDHRVALLNIGNKNYCKRYTDGVLSGFCANDSTLSVHSRLGVVELVESRRIHHVRFHLGMVRYYNLKGEINIATGEAVNSTEEPITVEMKLSYTNIQENTWKSTASTKLGGVKTRLESPIPTYQASTVDNYAGDYEWGTVLKLKSVVETGPEKVTVPPKSKVKVSLVAKSISIDMPFSYAQRDTLTNGKEVTYDLEDGIFTGVRTYDYEFKYEQVAQNEEKLAAASEQVAEEEEKLAAANEQVAEEEEKLAAASFENNGV